MTEVRRINDAGMALIKEFEGLRLEAYQDEAGVWTIGYGHTRGVREGMSVGFGGADALLETDLCVLEHDVFAWMHRVCKSTFPGLTDNEHAALLSLAFNVGPGCLSPALAGLLNDDKRKVPDWIRLWCHITAGGQKIVSKGLQRRREAEVQLWLTPDAQGGVS